MFICCIYMTYGKKHFRVFKYGSLRGIPGGKIRGGLTVSGTVKVWEKKLDFWEKITGKTGLSVFKNLITRFR